MEEHEQDLHFRKGDVIEVCQENIPELGDGWSLGRLHSSDVGFFPANYTRPVTSNVHATARHPRRAELAQPISAALVAEVTELRIEEAAKMAVLDVAIPIRMAVIAELEAGPDNGKGGLPSSANNSSWKQMTWQERLTEINVHLGKATAAALGVVAPDTLGGQELWLHEESISSATAGGASMPKMQGGSRSRETSVVPNAPNPSSQAAEARAGRAEDMLAVAMATAVAHDNLQTVLAMLEQASLFFPDNP